MGGRGGGCFYYLEEQYNGRGDIKDPLGRGGLGEEVPDNAAESVLERGGRVLCQ